MELGRLTIGALSLLGIVRGTCPAAQAEAWNHADRVISEGTSLSSDGRQVFYSYRLANGGCRLAVRSLSDENRDMFTIGSKNCHLKWSGWSPNNKYIVYLSEENGASTLWVFDTQTRRLNELRALGCRSLLPDVRPVWRNKSDEIIVSCALEENSQASNRLQSGERALWEELRGYRNGKDGYTLLQSGSDAERARSGFVSAASAGTRWGVFRIPIGEGSPQLAVVGDRLLQDLRLDAEGRGYLVVQDGAALRSGAYPLQRSSFFRLEIGPTAALHSVSRLTSDGDSPSYVNGDRLPKIVGSIPMGVSGQASSLSPDGKHIAWVPIGLEGHQGDIFAAGISDGTVANLSEGVASQTAEAGGVLRGKFGMYTLAPIWLSNRQVVALEAGLSSNGPRLWAFDLTTAGSARMISTPGKSIEAIAKCTANKPCFDGRQILIRYRDLNTQSQSFGLLEVATSRITPVQSAVATPPVSNIAEVDFNHEITAAGRSGISYQESSNEFPHLLWISFDKEANSQASGVIGSAHPADAPSVREILWKTQHGVDRRAALILPSGIKAAPVVVFAYWQSGGLVNTALSKFGGGVGTWDSLVEAGYAVLIPELSEGPADGHVCDRVAHDVLSALDATAASQRLDASRAALFGYSRGGGIANCVATRSSRFLAVISGAGFSDWTSQKLLYGFTTCSIISFDLGGCPWDAPQNYVRESPVYSIDKVSAPMFLFYGKQDNPMLIEQTLEMYNGLALLGKNATLFAVDGEDHGSVFQNSRVWPRIIFFLNSKIKHWH